MCAIAKTARRATIIVAGTNTSMSALRMFCAQGSIPSNTPLVIATTITSIADMCKKGIASCAVMLSSPTIIPMITSVTAIHSSMGRNPSIIASITPTRNAQLPMMLPVLFFAIAVFWLFLVLSVSVLSLISGFKAHIRC